MNDFYFEQLCHAVENLDIDIPDDPTVEDILDAAGNYAHYETFEKYGNTDDVSMTDEQCDFVHELINRVFFD